MGLGGFVGEYFWRLMGKRVGGYRSWGGGRINDFFEEGSVREHILERMLKTKSNKNRIHNFNFQKQSFLIITIISYLTSFI